MNDKIESGLVSHYSKIHRKIEDHTISYPLPSSYTPDDIRQAYNITSDYTGKNTTIAIIDVSSVSSYSHAKITSDYTTFCKQFNLPYAGLNIYTYPQTGGTIPTNTQGWGGEASLDIQWAHAIAPEANIILILTLNTKNQSASSLSTFAGAIGLALSKGADIISMSWGTSEFTSEAQLLLESIFSSPSASHVTFIASIGDSGGVISYPGCSNNVIGVGGTFLNYDKENSQYLGESAWYGSGGGVSRYIPQPSYQSAVNIPFSYTKRCTPDVGYIADPNTGVAVFISENITTGEWVQMGGTSVGAPCWAGIVALIYEKYGKVGTSNILKALYNLYNSSSYQSCFNDIILGESITVTNNGLSVQHSCNAGYDLVTGIGTPNVYNLINTISFE